MKFEQASRLKLRFSTPQGLLSAEDLWDLPLTSTRGRANLNDIAKAINAELKAAGEEDFVNPKPGGNDVLQLKMDLVKHVIAVIQSENESVRLAADRIEKKKQLLELIARKQNQELEGKSREELEAMVAAL